MTRTSSSRRVIIDGETKALVESMPCEMNLGNSVELAAAGVAVNFMRRFAGALLIAASPVLAVLQPAHAEVVVGYSGLACLRMELVFGV